MGIGQPPRNRKDRRRGHDNVVSLRRPEDDFFDVLSPLLEEAVTKREESPGGALPNVASLSKENARLRALAVGLSNLLGDLPVRRWEEAARSCRNKA
jgi:hypothetical protein